MRKTFIHTFSNGETCALVMDFTGEKPICDARWNKRKDKPEWDKIELEYHSWTRDCFTEFMKDLKPEEVVKVVKMTEHKWGQP